MIRLSTQPWRWAIAVPATLVAALVLVPLAYVFLRAGEAGWSTYLDHVLAAGTGRLLSQTLLLIAGVLTLALLVAVPLAWLVARTDLPGRRLWAVLAALPLVFPSYVAAFTLVAALGPRGYAQGWLAPLGVDRLPPWIYGYTGALLALAMFTYPYIYLLLVSALRGLDPAYEESARACGHGRWRAFFQIVLPQLRPALYSGGLLVVLYTISDFGAVSITRYNTFTVSIYNAYQAMFDRTAAAALASVLVLISLGFLALEAGLLRRVRPVLRRPARRATPVPLGPWRLPSLFFAGAVASFSVLLPIAVIGYWVVQVWLGGTTTVLLSSNHLDVTDEALRSLLVSSLAAGASVLLAVPVAVWAVRWRSRPARLVERLASTGYALPGLVIALSLVFFGARYARPLYQTLTLLVVAYVIRFLPEALAATRSALLAISPRFEEAARSLGRGGFTVLRTLTLPLMRRGLLAGAGLVFLTAMKELPATLLLRPIGFDTLAVRIWTDASEGIYAAAAIPSLLLVLVSAPPVYFLVIRPALAERHS